MAVLSSSSHAAVFLFVLLSTFLFVCIVEARTPLAVKEALRKAKEDAMTVSTPTTYVPPELDNSNEDISEDKEAGESTEEVREKMKAFDTEEMLSPSPSMAPSPLSSREEADEDVDEVTEKMNVFHSTNEDEIAPAASGYQEQQQEQEFVLGQPGTVTKLQEWSVETTTFKKKEKITITLSKFDDRKREQSFPDIQYKIDLKFVDRTCQYDHLKETFKSGSGEFLSELVKDQQIGPDEIFAQIEGPSLQTRVFLSNDLCAAYYTQFYVPVGGIYMLKIFRTRGDYTGVIENDGQFPLMQLETFIDTKLDFSLEKTYYLCPRVQNTFEDGFWRIKENLSPFFTKTISVQSEIQAEDRGLPLMTNIEISKDMANDHCARKIDRFVWTNSLCDTGASHEDSYIDINRSSHLLKKRSIVFVGDSHMRGLADSFLSLSCGVKRKGGVYMKDESKMQLFTVKDTDEYCSGLTMAYLPLTNCEDTIPDQIDGFNFAVLNCGHHPASKLHYSYHKYTDAVSNLLNRLYEKKLKNEAGKRHWPMMLWLDMTAQPLRQDKYVILKQDWRTYHRLMLFQAIALKEIKGTSANSKYPNEVKMQVIPAFASTLTMFDKMCDNAHYPNDAKIPQVQQLLHKISSYEQHHTQDLDDTLKLQKGTLTTDISN